MSSESINIEQHIPLVKHIICRFFMSHPMDFDDKLQYGCVGLIKAARTYKPGICTFSTYAGQCIKNEIYYAMRRYKKHSQVLSLDFNESVEDDSIALKDIIPDNTINVEESYIQRTELAEAYSKASDNTKLVIQLRMRGYTFKEIGQVLGGTHGLASNILYRFAKDVGYKVNQRVKKGGAQHD